MEINPEKYGNLRNGSSISIHTSAETVKKIIEYPGTSTTAGDISRASGIDFKLDKDMMNDIEGWYARALDNVGMNFRDPIQAYGTKFNKYMQTLGLDPQRPGNSYVFFTRPDLNFVSNDLSPFFRHVMQTEIGNFVAEYLQYPNINPRYTGIKLDSKFKTDSPFDPLKSNLCKEVSGAKDIVLDSFETVGNFTGHQMTYATGADGYDSIGELTVTFEDTHLSPIFLSTYLLIMYIHEVSRGSFSPKYDYIVKRMIDYTSSIYVFKLAEDNETIMRWAKWTGAYPISIPLNALNYSREIKLDELEEVSVTYKYNFYEPMNPRVFQDFNKLALPTVLSNYKDIFQNIKNKDGSTGSTLDQFNNTIRAGSGFEPLKEDIAFELQLMSREFPERLVEDLLANEGLEASTERAESAWSKSPFILGNKLLFL